MSAPEIRVNDGATVVLLPVDDARRLVEALPVPDPTNRWLWTHAGHALAEPAYGPPSLRLDSVDASAAGIYSLRRMATSDRDTRLLPAGPARRWSLVVQHRHHVMALSPGVQTLTLSEPLAAHWIRWGRVPTEAELVDALNAALAPVREQLQRNADVLHTLPVAADIVCRLLYMTQRADGAWTWIAGSDKRSLHADGPPQFVDYATWPANAMGGVAAQRAVMAWVAPDVVRIHRGRFVHADAGLWLAESADGVLLAAYELHNVGAALLPSYMADGFGVDRIRRLDDAHAKTVVVQQNAGEPLRPVTLSFDSPPIGVLRWYYVWVPNVPGAWTGSSADIRAVVASACSHYALGAPADEDTNKHTVNVSALLATQTGAAALLAGETVAVAVLLYAELDAPPPPIVSLTAEKGIVVPRRNRPAKPSIHELAVGEPAVEPPGDVLPSLAWRQLVGAALIVVHQPPIEAPRLALIDAPVQQRRTFSAEACARARATLEFVPPPPSMRTTDAPPLAVPFGTMIYRLWANRRNAVRMLAESGGDLARLAAMNMTQLAAAGLHQSIVDAQAGIWLPAAGEPCIVAPYELEQVPMFASDGLDAQFVAWLGVMRDTTAVDAPPDVWALRAMANQLSDGQLGHLLDKYNDMAGVLRYEHGQRQLPLWMVEQTQDMGAAEMPIAAMFGRGFMPDLHYAGVIAYTKKRLDAYARAAVGMRGLRHPARSGETPEQYAARLTCDMLQPALVADVINAANCAEAALVRALPTLPIELFVNHWTLPDVYSPLHIGQRRVGELCAAYYEGGSKPSDKEYHEDCRANAPLVGILDLLADQPVRRIHDQRNRNYDGWRRAFDAQVDAAYVFADDLAPKRPLPASAPSVGAFLAAADALPLSAADHRRLVAERKDRAKQIAPHEQLVRDLHAPPATMLFAAAGGWSNDKLASAARAYMAAYAGLLRAYAALDMEASADLSALNNARMALERAIAAQTDKAEMERRQAAERLIAAPMGTNAPAAAGTPTAPPAIAQPAKDDTNPFGLAVWNYAYNSMPRTTTSGKVHGRNKTLKGLSRAQFDAMSGKSIRDAFYTAMRELAPLPVRVPTHEQLRQRVAHLVLLLGRIGGAAYDDYQKAATDEAMKAFVDAVRGIVLPNEPANNDWPATILATHKQLWAAGMRAALDRIGYGAMLQQFLVDMPPDPAWFDTDAGRPPARLAELQRDSRFFRPHPREACFMSAALNTFVGMDPDESRDTTSLQRAVWTERLNELARAPAVPGATSLGWSADEKRAMMLQRKTPEMLARIAVRLSIGDFVQRGPETRLIVPPRLLDQLLVALVTSPTMFDALERHGLDATLPEPDRISHKLVAVWRAGDAPFVTVDAADADTMLDATSAEAPAVVAPLRAMAVRLQLPPAVLWRYVLFGAASAVALVRDLDTRNIAELALFVVELDRQVTAAIKTLDKETAALFDAVDRVALLHTCFAWHVGYLLSPLASRRIFVRQRHPDGRLVYDDFGAAVVPAVLRDIYGIRAIERVPLDSEWEARLEQLMSGFVYGGNDATVGDANARTLRETIYREALEQPRLLWRVRSHDEPMLTTSDLVRGTVSCWSRFANLAASDDDVATGNAVKLLYDVSPMAGIDRRPAPDEGLPEGRDVAYHEENNVFALDSAYSYYEWRVGLDCFLAPDKAKLNRISHAPFLSQETISLTSAASSATTPAYAQLMQNPPIDMWPLATARLRRLHRWASLGWRRVPNVDAARKAWDASANDPKVQIADIDNVAPDDEDMPVSQSNAVLKQIRAQLAERLEDAIAAEHERVNTDGRQVPNPMKSATAAPATDWTAADTAVLRRTRELVGALLGAVPAGYSDAQHAAEENRVATVEAGLRVYGDYYLAALDAVQAAIDAMPAVPATLVIPSS